MLTYAVEQFFESGGRRAIVVRVVNGAHPPTLSIPAGTQLLRLRGVNPGSREYLRASVDYDGIEAHEADRFNLVVQRVRIPGSELIEDQEIFRRVSIKEGSSRFVCDAMLESKLARPCGDVPAVRPDRTLSGTSGPLIGYVHSNPDGDDGAPLSDYDIIGSAARGTGLFAFSQDDQFDLMCIPPLGRSQDVGSTALLVAARLCRERHATLLVDPPLEWSSAQHALTQLRAWPFRSDNALMFFPRMLAADRLRNRIETFGSAAVAAGLIARAEESSPLWSPAAAEELSLRPGMRPALSVTEAERLQLARAGVNTLPATRSAAGTAPALCTLSPGSGRAADGHHFGARRLAGYVIAGIERRTRALATATPVPETWARARDEAEALLGELAAVGAFAGSEPREQYFVVCDERVNRAGRHAPGGFSLLTGFAPIRPGDFETWLVTYEAGRCYSRPIAVNRMAASRLSA